MREGTHIPQAYQMGYHTKVIVFKALAAVSEFLGDVFSLWTNSQVGICIGESRRRATLATNGKCHFLTRIRLAPTRSSFVASKDLLCYLLSGIWTFGQSSLEAFLLQQVPHTVHIWKKSVLTKSKVQISHDSTSQRRYLLLQPLFSGIMALGINLLSI